MVNYLRWLAAELHLPEELRGPLNEQGALEWFCQTLATPGLHTLQSRYQALAGMDHAVFVFPAEKLLVEKILVPLHQAKVAFVLGHELGCIALCGLVGEMLTVFKFQISTKGTGPTALSCNQQKRLFGGEVESLQQSRRIGALELLGVIDTETATLLIELSATRNKYIHRLSHSHDTMSRDAARTYSIAAQLVGKLLGLGLSGFSSTIAPDVLDYLSRLRSQSHSPATSDLSEAPITNPDELAT